MAAVPVSSNCPHMGFRCPNTTEVAAVRQAVADGVITWHAAPFNPQYEVSTAVQVVLLNLQAGCGGLTDPSQLVSHILTPCYQQSCHATVCHNMRDSRRLQCFYMDACRDVSLV